jgi:hypothetical protein
MKEGTCSMSHLSCWWSRKTAFWLESSKPVSWSASIPVCICMHTVLVPQQSIKQPRQLFLEEENEFIAAFF